jgi:hypothetical protein
MREPVVSLEVNQILEHAQAFHEFHLFASPLLPRSNERIRGSRCSSRGRKMARLSKRLIDGLKPVASGEMFVWDDELRGFGLRIKSTGVKTYIIQYRNADGLTRRLVLGKHGVLAPEQARKLALQRLASVAGGSDPSAERHALRAGLTVTEVCDWYLEEATSGRLLGRSRRAIKSSSIKGDRGRIDNHIKPLQWV